MDIKEEHILGDALSDHWYYVAKGRALEQYLNNINVDGVLDVGAGSGIFSRRLLDKGIAAEAVCVDPNYAQESSEQHNGKSISFVRGTHSVPQKLILMMDVLEHVEDDVALLKQYSDPMPSDGQVLITVPAFQFLWSGHDVFLEHYRRYTQSMLEETVGKAGLEVVRIHYFFGLLFPLAVFIRCAKKLLLKSGALEPRSEMKMAAPWLNSLLITLNDLERCLLFPVNRLGGLTIFCLCRKPGGRK